MYSPSVSINVEIKAKNKNKINNEIVSLKVGSFFLHSAESDNIGDIGDIGYNRNECQDSQMSNLQLSNCKLILRIINSRNLDDFLTFAFHRWITS